MQYHVSGKELIHCLYLHAYTSDHQQGINNLDWIFSPVHGDNNMAWSSAIAIDHTQTDTFASCCPGNAQGTAQARSELIKAGIRKMSPAEVSRVRKNGVTTRGCLVFNKVEEAVIFKSIKEEWPHYQLCLALPHRDPRKLSHKRAEMKIKMNKGLL